jgi:glyoxylase I family protein
MERGTINHLALTVSDLVRSTEFYDRVLGFMGYTRVEVPETTQQAMKTALRAWAGPGSSITLRPAKGPSAGRAHDRNAPGLNHIAFNADSRADVHKLHGLLEEMRA